MAQVFPLLNRASWGLNKNRTNSAGSGKTRRRNRRESRFFFFLVHSVPIRWGAVAVAAIPERRCTIESAQALSEATFRSPGVTSRSPPLKPLKTWARQLAVKEILVQGVSNLRS